MTYRWQLPTLETHGRLPSEDEEQKDFVMWFRKRWPGVLIYSVPNEGKRTPSYANQLKCKGLVSGIPDLHVGEWDWYPEMKDQEGGDVGTKKHEIQLKIHEQLRRAGKRVDVCWGSVAAQALAIEVEEEVRRRKTDAA